MRRRLTALGTVAAVVALVVTVSPAAAEGDIIGAGNPAAIKDSYIVVYTEAASARGVDALTGQLAALYDAKVEHTYRYALCGFAGTFSEETARRLAADPAVDHVQQNAKVRVADTQPNPPSWGLDRIDQRDLPMDNSFTYPNTAANVTAYIIPAAPRSRGP